MRKTLIEGDDSGNAIEIIGLLRAAASSGESPNYYVQLIVLGNGRIGKTCLIERLAGADKCPEKLVYDYTHGIAIRELTKGAFEPEVQLAENLRLKVWDFGGQEIYYASHQFFLSEEAAYIYVWTDEEIVKANKEKAREALKLQGKALPEQAYDKIRSHEYWLGNIRMHGKNSPVLVVKTHCLDASEHFPYERLKQSYDLKQPALDFDAESPEPRYLSKLKKELAKSITSLPLWGAPFPNSYREARKIIAQLKNEGIQELSREAFTKKVVQKARIEEKDTDKLLSYLKKMGEIVHFPGVELLSNRIFINPEALTGKIYQLIKDHAGLSAKNGVFDEAYAREKLGADWEALLELLKAFELIYRKESSEQIEYIAPQYLTRNPAAFKVARHEKQLLFTLSYPRFLPENVMVNVLSHYGPYAIDEVYQNSIYFVEKESGAGCIIDVDFDKRQIKVYVGKVEKAMPIGKAVYKKFIELSKKAEVEISIDGHRWVSTKGLQDKIDNDRDLYDMEQKFLEDTSGFAFLKETKETMAREEIRLKSYKRPESNIISVALLEDTGRLEHFKQAMPKKILFLAASPTRAGQMNTGSESRFKDLFRYFDEEKKYTIVGEHGVTSEQFQNFLIHENPQFVHYGGHGSKEGIILEDETLDGDILVELLAISEQTTCVILNACNSLPIAKKIAQYVPYVIGTWKSINDDTAIAFARGFYMGIVAGHTIEKAFKLGIINIKREKLEGEDIPILVKGVIKKQS